MLHTKSHPIIITPIITLINPPNAKKANERVYIEKEEKVSINQNFSKRFPKNSKRMLECWRGKK